MRRYVLLRDRGANAGGRGGVLGDEPLTASRDSEPRAGSGTAAFLVQRRPRRARSAVSGQPGLVSGVARSFRPLPWQRTCGPAPRWTSSHGQPCELGDPQPAVYLIVECPPRSLTVSGRGNRKKSQVLVVSVKVSGEVFDQRPTRQLAKLLARGPSSAATPPAASIAGVTLCAT